MDEQKVICSNCGEPDNVFKSWNCHKCRIWNNFDIIKKEITKKRGTKKWLS